MGILFYEAIMH